MEHSNNSKMYVDPTSDVHVDSIFRQVAARVAANGLGPFNLVIANLACLDSLMPAVAVANSAQEIRFVALLLGIQLMREMHMDRSAKTAAFVHRAKTQLASLAFVDNIDSRMLTNDVFIADYNQDRDLSFSTLVALLRLRGDWETAACICEGFEQMSLSDFNADGVADIWMDTIILFGALGQAASVWYLAHNIVSKWNIGLRI